MLNKITKQRIDHCRDILVGQLPLPSDQINMITILLIYKFMNDIDKQNKSLGGKQWFINELENSSWENIINNPVANNENLADRKRKLFFEGINQIKNAENIPQLFKDIFTEGNIPSIADNEVFGRLLAEINKFQYDHSEELGNAFEYLLMTMGTQSKNGQFRTPRHIIDFLVEVVNPDIKDTFLDPACGTAGFLIAAFNFLRWKYTPEENKEVLMNIEEIEIEKKVKGIITKEKIIQNYKIYSTNIAIFIDNQKKDKKNQIPEAEVLNNDLTYKLKNAQIIYKKHTLYIKNGQLTHNGTHWIIQNFEITKIKMYKSEANFKAPQQLTLKPIQYINIFNERQRKTNDRIKDAEIFQGYDNTPLMVRLAEVNLYLHGFPNPTIHNYDTISIDAKWDENFSCILANPPFMTPKGGVKAHSKFTFESTKAEILFSDYILSHLKTDGKAGFIVPEGIIFTNNEDYTNLRKQMINDLGLYGVISLPAGVFQPYSGVKTSILLIDKHIAKRTNNLILVKINNDGYSLNTNRNALETSDLPNAIDLLLEYKNRINEQLTHNQETLAETHKNVDFQILDKQTFAKLDAYKASNTALHTLKREYKTLKDYEQKLPEKPQNKQIEKLEALKNDFLKNTQLPHIPADEQALKTLFETHIKAKTIEYGSLEMTENNENALAYLYKTAIDAQREYNLSFDKYAFNEEVKKGKWERVRLGEVCEITTGKKDVNYKNDNGIYPFFTCAEGQFKSPDYSFDCTAVLLPGNGANVGKVFFYEGKFEAYQRTYVLYNFLETLLPKFVFYIFLNKWNSYIANKQYGTATNYIVLPDLENFLIPLPPLSIQQKIVTEIESYQKVIDGARQVIDNYVPSFEIKEEWERVRLGEVCSLITDGVHQKPNYVESGIKFLSATNVVNGKIDFENVKYINEEEHLIFSKRLRPQKYDILLYKNGANSGVSAINDTDEIFDIYVSLALLRPLEVINPYYLNFAINSFFVKEQFVSRFKGVGVPNLHLNEIQETLIPLPSLSEQLAIVAILEQEREVVLGCGRLVESYEEKIRRVIAGIFEGE
ncbi:MAG: restriction endonuclease subunit M/S [Cytophagales bacterium]|nr:MAG: restriction endonuclease subunit M/S [Cytophagales bacterium]